MIWGVGLPRMKVNVQMQVGLKPDNGGHKRSNVGLKSDLQRWVFPSSYVTKWFIYCPKAPPAQTFVIMFDAGAYLPRLIAAFP